MSAPLHRILKRRTRRVAQAVFRPLIATHSSSSNAPSVYVVLVVDTEGGLGRRPRRRGRQEDTAALSPDGFRPGGAVWQTFQDRWRLRHRDALGQSPRLSWFVRFDRQVQAAGGRGLLYAALREVGGAALVRYGDEIGWHHHHLREGGLSAPWRFDTDYDGNRDHETALAAFLQTTGTFPCVFRSGALVETPSLHRWLREYIPFDYTLLVGPPAKRRRLDAELGIAMDWTAAPNDWSFYHPAAEDYQRPGASGRVIFPCTVNLRGAMAAFLRARDVPVVLAFSVHDDEPIVERFTAFLRRIAHYSRASKVGYVFAGAAEAARQVLGLDGGPPEFALSPVAGGLDVMSSAPLFGRAPFAAATRDGVVEPVPVRPSGRFRWHVAVRPRDEHILVASASRTGGGRVLMCPLDQVPCVSA